jgi:hypothetical protein
MSDFTLKRVWKYLRRYGFATGSTDGPAAFAEALEKFRDYYGQGPQALATAVHGGPLLDAEVLHIMSFGQCGLFRYDRVVEGSALAMADVADGSLCRWEDRDLKYTLGRGIGNGGEFTTVKRMLKRWSDLGGVTFTEVTQDADAHFKVEWVSSAEDPILAEAIAHAGLPLTWSPFPQPKPLRFDRDEAWGGIHYNIGAVALHEIGHILGLDDTPDHTSVMFHVFREADPGRQLSTRDKDEFTRRYPVVNATFGQPILGNTGTVPVIHL